MQVCDYIGFTLVMISKHSLHHIDLYTDVSNQVSKVVEDC